MSELINNRENRQKILKELIMELHNGKSIEEVKPRFEKLIQGVTTSEITAMEEALIKEGMPVENVQALCDVHSAVFKGSIEDIHRIDSPIDIPGHPLHTLKIENETLEKLIEEKIKKNLKEYKENNSTEVKDKLINDFKQLLGIDKHYQRKEYLLFPHLEKYGITAPPKVMWGVDDEIRNAIKTIIKMLSEAEKKEIITVKMDDTINRIIEMIYKEKNILFPLTIDYFTEDEWIKIDQESDEIGYFLIQPESKWIPARVNLEKQQDLYEDTEKDYVKFETGVLSFKELHILFNTLPIDITFIDKDDIVKYFSQGKERIFTRTKSVIGRSVENCHPPASVHVVDEMLDDFKSGKKDKEDFWILMGDMYVYIRYFALRDENNEYIGTIEVTQNVKQIQQLQGEKRLMS